MAKAKRVHYVDNKKLLQAMIEWKEFCVLEEKEGKVQPPVTNYIGECFLKIATHLSYSGLPVPSIIPGISLNCLLTS